MPKYIFYFHDNKVQYIKKSEIKTYQFPIDCLLYGKMINIEKFIKELKIFFKKEKLSSLIMPSIRIITPVNFYNTDKELFLMAFNSLGINKIEFKNEIDYSPLKKNNALLNVCDTSITKTTITKDLPKSIVYPFNLFKDKKQLLQIICQDKEESYILIGTNSLVPDYVEILKKQNYEKVHYYNNYQTFIIEKSLKN